MSGISRRESIRRAGLLALGTGIPFSFVACAEQGAPAWQPVSLKPVVAQGYGTDPDLVHPAAVPWPKTLTKPQIDTVSVLVDLLIPSEGDLPSATQVGVVEVLDEWVSAPYPIQQQHRVVLLSGFDWCNQVCQIRTGNTFAKAQSADQLAIIDDIAVADTSGSIALEGPRHFFDLLRRLTAGAYYTSPAGTRELGYQGNTPIVGDYPGPSDEAMAHLKEQLRALGLSLP